MSSLAFATLAVGAVAATVVDLRTRRIPNALTAGMCALGMGFAAAGVSGITFWMALAGIGLGLALMLPGHLLGATGAGDVKLMAAVGAIVGPATVVTAFLFTAIAGGVLALIVAIRRRRLATTVARTGRLLAGADGAGQEIRAERANRFAYGPAIAVGSVLAALAG